mmetsp:Transcript_53014/g.87155  ORF Transcript_53014/g.87155 Transcript_53014/m.87155 type:complete len:107 (-) Transcript_53014:385-705(-)
MACHPLNRTMATPWTAFPGVLPLSIKLHSSDAGHVGQFHMDVSLMFRCPETSVTRSRIFLFFFVCLCFSAVRHSLRDMHIAWHLSHAVNMFSVDGPRTFWTCALYL